MQSWLGALSGLDLTDAIAMSRFLLSSKSRAEKRTGFPASLLCRV